MVSNSVRATALLLAGASAPAFAQAPACPVAGATAIEVGRVAPVPAGNAAAFTVSLKAGEAVIVDLSTLGASPSSEGEEGPRRRSLRLCDGKGALLAPLPGEVFEKGGSVVATEDGERMRFVAHASGSYIVSVPSDASAREVLVRRREGGSTQAPIVSATLGSPQKGVVASGAPMTFSFSGTAGQWVEFKVSSERDTLLRLAAPDREGAYSVVAENDDTEGLNPLIRRRLPVTGTYFVQVDSLAEEAGEFDLDLSPIDAPKPPPPPLVLRAGTPATGKLANDADARVYALPVAAGRSYRIELTAPYDGVVGIGVSSPVEADDGGRVADAGFAEIKSQDTGTSGTERLTFTARAAGQVLVRVKSFGIGESDGGFTLSVTDLGS